MILFRFLVRREALFAIPKASRVEQVVENTGAGELDLDADALAKVDAAFPRGRRLREPPMV